MGVYRRSPISEILLNTYTRTSTEPLDIGWNDLVVFFDISQKRLRTELGWHRSDTDELAQKGMVAADPVYCIGLQF